MDRIDNYKIIKKIGEGGMGEVYKGLDTMLEREVAIKLMRPELCNRPEILERFRSEAIALGRLNHSNIAAVYNFGQTQNQYYMALEFVSGETLDSIIKLQGRIPWRIALNYAIAALEGLEHAHQLKIIHRDIKPANIMINEQGNVKIMDFGIARILGKARMTQTGRFIGTLEYMPPEQIQGKDADARSDVYAMGAVLYEMLTGHIPFERDTEYELMNSHLTEKPKPLRQFNHEVSLDLEKIVLRALEKDPGKRFASALEFSQILRKLVLTEALEPSLAGRNSFFTFCRDYPVVVIAALLLLPAGSYVLWQLDLAKPQEGLSDIKASPLEQSIVKMTPYEKIENNQPIENSIDTSIASKKAPMVENIPSLPDSMEEQISSESEFELVPVPERKPMEIAPSIKQAKESRKSASPQRSEGKEISKLSNEPLVESDPQIDKWAEEFFKK